ncbi:hypothetical protein Tco_1260532 [Tanacetum coccineum]
MLESKAYQTYYAFASGEKDPKPKYVQKKVDSKKFPKKKTVQATKGTRLKSKAKVAKSDKKKQPAKKPKAKGLAVLSKVALTKAEQLKLATKRSKTQFHSSYVSGSSDGVDTQSKVPDEQQLKTSGTDEGTGTKPGVPDVPIYESESEKESWGDNEDDENDSDDISDEGNDDNDGNDGNDGDDDDANDNDKQEGDDTNKDDEEIDITTEYYEEEEEKIDDEEMMYDDEDDEVTKDLYEDVNQVDEDAHVTLTSVLDTQKADEPVQSSSVSFDFTSKLLNLKKPSPANNEIASLMETLTLHATAVPEITSRFATTIPPPPPFFNPLLQHATPAPTPTTSEATTLFTSLLDFASVFKFNERAIQAHNFDCREQAQAEKREYIELVDSMIRTIIKEEVNAQLTQILPQAISDVATPVIEENVTESLEAAVLTRSSSQPQSSYEAAATLSEFEFTKILIDKMERNKSYDIADHKRELYDALVKSYQIDKDLFDSYDLRSKEKKSSSTSKDTSQSQHKSSIKSSHVEEPSHTIEDSGMQQDQEFITGYNDEQLANKEVTKADWFKKPERPPTPDPDWSKRQHVDFRPPQS